MLTYEQAQRVFCYEPDTGIVRWKIGRANVKAGSIAGSLNKNGYVDMRYEGYRFYAHRLAILLTTGSWPSGKMVVDHINGDPSDNRISNLRVGSQADNCANSISVKRSATGHKGVYLHKPTGGYRVKIRRGMKDVHVGLYLDLKEAIAARANAEDLYFGEFSSRHRGDN